MEGGFRPNLLVVNAFGFSLQVPGRDRCTILAIRRERCSLVQFTTREIPLLPMLLPRKTVYPGSHSEPD